MASQKMPRVLRLSFAWRLGFLYAALFLVVGCYLPYLPGWLDWRKRGARAEAALLRPQPPPPSPPGAAPCSFLFAPPGSRNPARDALYYSFGALNWRAQGIPDG